MSIFPVKGQKTLWREGGEVPQKPSVPGGGDQSGLGPMGFLGRDACLWPGVEGYEPASHSTSGGFYRS